MVTLLEFAIGFIMTFLAVMIIVSQYLEIKEANEQATKYFLENVALKDGLVKCHTNLELAYQRIDELEERCGRLHGDLLASMKRRGKAVWWYEPRSAGTGMQNWLN